VDDIHNGHNFCFRRQSEHLGVAECKVGPNVEAPMIRVLRKWLNKVCFINWCLFSISISIFCITNFCIALRHSGSIFVCVATAKIASTSLRILSHCAVLCYSVPPPSTSTPVFFRILFFSHIKHLTTPTIPTQTTGNIRNLFYHLKSTGTKLGSVRNR